MTNLQTITANDTIHMLDGGPGYGPYRAVTGVINHFGQGPGLLHLFPTHELTSTRPQAECGIRTGHGLITITENIPEAGVCTHCENALKYRGARR